MRITSETVADGIREQLFTIGDVPGVLWTPAEGSGPRPLVLIGHGGGQHKKEPGVLSRAFPYVIPDWQATLDALQKPTGKSRPSRSTARSGSSPATWAARAPRAAPDTTGTVPAAGHPQPIDSDSKRSPRNSRQSRIP